jgi:hypothetical protein
VLEPEPQIGAEAGGTTLEEDSPMQEDQTPSKGIPTQMTDATDVVATNIGPGTAPKTEQTLSTSWMKNLPLTR